MPDTTDIGNRMKEYEAIEAQRRFLPQLPVVARIDGRSFSKWTKKLERPYDTRLSSLMGNTTKYLVEEAHALVGYTQSDEITLLFYQEHYDSDIFFKGRIQKLTSVLASIATAYFNTEVPNYLPNKAGDLAHFDCRVWQLPSKAEAANVFLWREMDATKNSIAIAAQQYYSHKELHKKGGKEMQDMLMQKGVNWNDYPAFFRRGTFVRYVTKEEPFTAEELATLPPKHHAHTNPELLVRRRFLKCESLPPLLKIANRVEVLFDGAEPISHGQD